MKSFSKFLLSLTVAAFLSGSADAALNFDKLVGLGVDDANRPWIAGTFDTTGDGLPDRIQMNRYTGGGDDDLGFDPSGGGSESWLDIQGGTGVDTGGGGTNNFPWFAGDRDAEPDSVRNDITSRRYNPFTGGDQLGYGVDGAVPNVGTNQRGLGVQLATNQRFFLGLQDQGPNNGKLLIFRINNVGGENFGTNLDTAGAGDWNPSTTSGVGLGNQNGDNLYTTQNLAFVTGVLNNGTPTIRSYSLGTGLEVGGWGVGGAGAGDFGPNVKGLGIDPAIGQPWIVGERNDGIFAARRWNPSAGTDNLGFNITSSLGDVIDVEGIGVGPNREPWVAVLLDTDADGTEDRWGIQSYDLGGVRQVDQLISSQFTIPEPAAIVLLGLGLVGLAGVRQRRS